MVSETIISTKVVFRKYVVQLFKYLGSANIRWPGLSAPVIRGRELVQRQQLPEDKSIQENLHKLRDSVRRGRRQPVSPLDRGWSGGHPGGRKVGPPDPVEECKIFSLSFLTIFENVLIYLLYDSCDVF